MSKVSGNNVAMLFIIPLACIFFAALTMNIFVKPFIDMGIDAPTMDTGTQLLDAFTHFVFTGGTYFTGVLTVNLPILGSWDMSTMLSVVNPSSWIIAIMPSGIADFLNSQIDLLFYMPTIILFPFIVLTTLAYLLGTYMLVVMLIP